MMTGFSHVRPVQKIGLGIMELLTMDSKEWRHEVHKRDGGGRSIKKS